MNFGGFPVSQALSKAVPTMQGFRSAVSVCVAGLLLVPPAPRLAAATPLSLDISTAFGPVATQLNITKPGGVRGATGGSAVSYNGDLIAIRQAVDTNTLVGGFLPAPIIFKQDLLKGWSFLNAAKTLRPRPSHSDVLPKCNVGRIRVAA